MNSRERVAATVEFAGPDMAPVSYWTSKGNVTDFAGSPVPAITPAELLERLSEP